MPAQMVSVNANHSLKNWVQIMLNMRSLYKQIQNHIL